MEFEHFVELRRQHVATIDMLWQLLYVQSLVGTYFLRYPNFIFFWGPYLTRPDFPAVDILIKLFARVGSDTAYGYQYCIDLLIVSIRLSHTHRLHVELELKYICFLIPIPNFKSYSHYRGYCGIPIGLFPFPFHSQTHTGKTIKCKCKQTTVEQQKNSSTKNWISNVEK